VRCPVRRGPAHEDCGEVEPTSDAHRTRRRVIQVEGNGCLLGLVSVGALWGSPSHKPPAEMPHRGALGPWSKTLCVEECPDCSIRRSVRRVR